MEVRRGGIMCYVGQSLNSSTVNLLKAERDWCHFGSTGGGVESSIRGPLCRPKGGGSVDRSWPGGTGGKIEGGRDDVFF